MNTTTVYSKTAMGMTELANRKLKLPQSLRNALILVDGTHALSHLALDAKKMGAPADFIEQLLSLGLIAKATNDLADTLQAANDDVVTNPPVQRDEFTLFRAAKDFINVTAVDAMGIKSFFFILKLEKAGTRVDLVSLLPDYIKAMSKALGADAAQVLADRLKLMLR